MDFYLCLYLPFVCLHVSISRALPLALASWRILSTCRLRLVTYSFMESFKWITSFRPFVCRTLRVRLSTEFSGGESLVTGLYAKPLSFTFWSSLVRVGLVFLTVVTPVRLPTHRYLLAGVGQSDFVLTRFSSRFPRLITSRTQGDDAFLRFTRGWGFHPTSNRQLLRC